MNDLAVALPRRCPRCTDCNQCRFEVQEVSRREQQELALLRDHIHLDDELNRCVCTYPVIGNIKQLTDNRWQAVKMAESLEKKLRRKDGGTEAYNKEFEGYLSHI